ncbi:MAG: hypothetical protein IPO71_02050 [Nitrosomonas sp.]|nr:hypothetical protein [Nitrosomonas sp.]
MRRRAVIDATLIESARPKKTITLRWMPVRLFSLKMAVSLESVHRRTKCGSGCDLAEKGKKSQFGYRSYLVVDAQDGYVRGIHTPANQSEMIHFEAAIDVAQ